MHRSYRTRHSKDLIGPILNDYVPIQIIVRLMSGKYHTLFTENDNETFLDVKMALLPHIDISPLPKPGLEQLVFQSGNQQIGYENVDDSTIVSSLLTPVIELQLLLLEREWTTEQQRIIDMTSDEHVVAKTYEIETPAKMEAFRWALQNNSSILSLRIIRTPNTTRLVLPTIMDFLRQSTSIQRLELDGIGDIGVDDTAELFDIIGRNNSLLSIKIVSCRYRLNDLSTLLTQTTSLRSVNLSVCKIEVEDDDITRFGNVISHQYTLELLSLKFSKIVGDDNGLQAGILRDTFQSLGSIGNAPKRKNDIDIDWRNPNA